MFKVKTSFYNYVVTINFIQVYYICNIYQYVKFSFNFKLPLQLVNESCQNYLMNVFVPDFVRLVQIEYPGLSYTRSMK